MHGAVLLDAAGEVLRPAILWNDQRTAAECDAIRDAVGPERLIEITGNDALTGLHRAEARVGPRPRARRLGAGRPRAAAQGLRPAAADRRVRARQGRRRRRRSSSTSPRATGRPRSSTRSGSTRPGCRGPTRAREVTGTVSAAAAAATGLRAGTPVVAGGGDQAANAVGVGVGRPGSMALSLGTSGVVFAATDRPIHEPRGIVHAFCHAVPDRWHMMSVMLSAAGSLRWFRDALAPGEDFGDLRRVGRGGPAGERRPVLPPLPHRRAQPAPRPARPAARSSA